VLAASEAKAREISRIIAEQSALATRNLEQEIERLEETSGGQITQAVRVLRDQHERAMAAMNEMPSSTATDFQQTAQDMRLTAQQVVKDIDAARGDLMRALTELPGGDPLQRRCHAPRGGRPDRRALGTGRRGEAPGRARWTSRVPVPAAARSPTKN